MHDSTHTKRLTRVRRAHLLAAAALVSGAVVVGCGGSAPSPTTATVAGAAAPVSRTASSGSRTAAADVSPGLGFARCMRSSGVPNFPDPTPGRGLLFPVGGGFNPSSPAVTAAQAKCKKLLPGGGLPGPGAKTHPSAQTLAKLVRIAECMRQHGVSQFPDPRTSVPANLAGIDQITDFDGAILLFPHTLNLQAPAYKLALTACGAPPLGLPH